MKKNVADRLWLLILGLAALGVMTAIFCLSQQNGTESYELSKAVLDEVKEKGLEVFIPKITIGTAPADGDKGFHFMLDGRKWAHFYLYALLGAAELLWWERLLVCRGGRLIRNEVRHKLPWAAALAFCFCLLYACTDEFHQLFVDSRGGSPGDVLYDALGVGLGILIAMTAYGLVSVLLKIRKRKRKV